MKKLNIIIKVLIILVILMANCKIIVHAAVQEPISISSSTGTIPGTNVPYPNSSSSGRESKADHTAGEVIDEADSFISMGEKEANGIISKEEMQQLTDTIYNILLVVAIVIAVLLAAILGIKFLMEGASGKAEVQKALIPYVIGCAVVFGSFTIWKIVLVVLQGLE